MAAAPPVNAPAKVRLGDLLIRDGLLRPDQLERGLEEQQAFGGRLGRHLVDLGFISEAVLLDALSRQLRIAKVDLDAPGAVSNDIARYVRADIAERMGFCPVSVDARTKVLTIAIADPEPQTLIDIEALTGMRIEPRLALLDAIDRVNRRLYDGSQLQVQQMRGLQPSRQAERPAPSSGSPTSIDEALGPPPARPSAPPPAAAAPLPPAYDAQLQQQIHQQLQQQLQQQQMIQMQLQNAAAPFAGQPTMGLASGGQTMQAVAYPPGYPQQPGYPSYPPQARPQPSATPAPAQSVPPPTRAATSEPSARVAPLLPSTPSPDVAELADQLKHLEKTLANQARALRSLVEVLVDKGLITKAEMARKQQK